MQETFQIHELSGPQLEPWLDALGALRIRVFRDYPYLYDGTLEYERDYLRTYLDAADSLVVIVTDAHGNPVGATTCLPLSDEGPEFQSPFFEQGHDVSQVLYFGESVLLPEWLRFAQGWYLFVFGSAVVLLMLWLPDGLLSIPDRLKAKRQAREASAARA